MKRISISYIIISVVWRICLGDEADLVGDVVDLEDNNEHGHILHIEACNDHDGIRFCACSTKDEFMVVPLNFTEFKNNCKPFTCECNDNSTQIIRQFGCRSGGMPGCGEDYTTFRFEDMVCRSGQTGDLVHNKQKKKNEQCLCDDGSFPVCKKEDGTAGNYPICHSDGTFYDTTIIHPIPPYLKTCNWPSRRNVTENEILFSSNQINYDRVLDLSVCNEHNGIRGCMCTVLNETVHPPMGIVEFKTTCKPNACLCNDGTVQTITEYGCPQGGIPRCGGGDTFFNYETMICQNGQTVSLELLHNKTIEGRCICDDLSLPVCMNEDGNPGDAPICNSDGNAYDMSLIMPRPMYLETCGISIVDDASQAAPVAEE